MLGLLAIVGSAYASIAALFNLANKKKKTEEESQEGLRFRLEIGEANGIGCVEQTAGEFTCQHTFLRELWIARGVYGLPHR